MTSANLYRPPNHLGHFALTIPQLLAASAARVVTVASLAHQNGKIDFDNLQSERGYKPWGLWRVEAGPYFVCKETGPPGARGA